MFWNSNAPQAPPLVQTDTIIPFFFKDDNLMKNVVVVTAHRFDYVLDEELLRSSLERLIEEHGHWRKLGARVRVNKEGKLEFHIPQKFDRKTRPSVDWTHTKFDVSIDEHPAGSAFPRPSAVPATFPVPPEMMEMISPQGLPQGLSPWIYHDRPVLIVHMMAFTDATILGFTWSHATMDGMGFKSIFTGWSAVLNGREGQIPYFACYDEDPLLPLTTKTPGDKYALKHMTSGTMTLVRYALNFVRETLLHKAEERIICIPGPFAEDLRRRATAEAQQATGDSKLWLSEGDVLTAWWARTVVGALNPTDDTPVALMNAMDIRDFAGGKNPRGSMYLGNALDSIVSFLPARDVREKGIAALALRTRRDNIRLRNQEQIEAKMQLDRAANGTVFLGPSNQLQLLFSNWHRCRFLDIDFSSAIVPGTEDRCKHRYTTREQSSFMFFNPCSRLSLRNAGPVVGRDGGGNWWMMWRMRKSAWPAVERVLEDMARFGWHADVDRARRASKL